MKLRLPVLPRPIPWKAHQWRSLRSADVADNPLFIRYCADWAGPSGKLDKAILGELLVRAGAKRIELASVPAILSAVHAWLTVAGGRRNSPALVFFIQTSLIRPFAELLVTPGITTEERLTLTGHIRRAGAAAQQAALIALSQRLGCAPIGLSDWRANK